MIKKNGCRESILTTVCDNRMITKFEKLTILLTMLYYKYNTVSNRIWFDSKHHQTNIGSIVELLGFWIDL